MSAFRVLKEEREEQGRTSSSLEGTPQGSKSVEREGTDSQNGGLKRHCRRETAICSLCQRRSSEASTCQLEIKGQDEGREGKEGARAQHSQNGLQTQLLEEPKVLLLRERASIYPSADLTRKELPITKRQTKISSGSSSPLCLPSPSLPPSLDSPSKSFRVLPTLAPHPPSPVVADTVAEGASEVGDRKKSSLEAEEVNVFRGEEERSLGRTSWWTKSWKWCEDD